jgi:hypothetical protein
MPTFKQSVGIAISIAMAFVAATAFGISAVEQSAPQVPTNRFTPSKADFRLNLRAPEITAGRVITDFNQGRDFGAVEVLSLLGD